jgi:hypoxanthine phosphoribosyltransferase
MKSYDYVHRQGVQPISWDDFASLTATLTEKIAQAGPVDLIIGMARAGLFPATAVACSLRRELYPVRVSRRVNDEIRYATPQWRVPVPPAVAGQVVAVIDEIADTGESLALVADRVRKLGAVQVISACLVSHSWANPAPDVVALVSDALILFPWDVQVYEQMRWIEHPELTAARAAQPKSPPEDSQES